MQRTIDVPEGLPPGTAFISLFFSPEVIRGKDEAEVRRIFGDLGWDAWRRLEEAE